MSAWKEWQEAMKRGDYEQAEESRMEYERECREQELMDRDYEIEVANEDD